MMNITLTAILFLYVFMSNRGTTTDSLLAVLETARGSPRVSVLHKLTQHYQDTDPEKTKQLLEEALTTARRTGNKLGEARSLLLLGTYYLKRGDYPPAKEHTFQALKIFEKEHHQKGMAECYKNIGAVHFYTGQYIQSKQHYQRALAIFQTIQDLEGQAKCYANIGLVYKYQSNYTEALSYFLDGLKIAQTLKDAESTGALYSYMAYVYYNMKDFPTALSYQLKALEIFEDTGNISRKVNILSDIGLVYLDQHEYAKALIYYHKSLSIAESLGKKREIGVIWNNLGAVYEGLENYPMALKYYTQSLDFKKETGEKATLPTTLRNIARLHQRLNHGAQALTYSYQSLVAAQEAGLKKELSGAHFTLSEIYASQKDFKSALAHYQKFTDYKDSIFDEEKTRQIAEMQTRFETEKKDQQIASQHQEINLLAQNKRIEERLRILFTIASLLLIAVLLFTYNRYRLKRKSAYMLDKKNKEIQEKNEQIRQINQELEKRMLRAQMDPHFIFNSLSSIQHFITINDKTSALKYLSKFSRLIRQVLENSVNIQIPIADEIKLLEYYLELETLRFQDKFEYVIEIEDSLDIYDTEIPFLLIQPYVENAIGHGLRYKEKGGKVNIKLEDHQHHILCTVEDNGIGRKEAQALDHKKRNHQSRGLSVSQQRLQLLNRHRASKTLITITDLYDEQQRATGTRIEILIPKTQKEETCFTLSS